MVIQVIREATLRMSKLVRKRAKCVSILTPEHA